MTDTAAQVAKSQLGLERDRLSRRQRQLSIVEKMVESWTEDQLDAMLELAAVWQMAAQQRMAQGREGRSAMSVAIRP